MIELYCYVVFGLVMNQAINGEPKSYRIKDMPLVTVVEYEEPRVDITTRNGDTYLEETGEELFYRKPQQVR